jgi:hypothetical protein
MYFYVNLHGLSNGEVKFYKTIHSIITPTKYDKNGLYLAHKTSEFFQTNDTGVFGVPNIP